MSHHAYTYRDETIQHGCPGHPPLLMCSTFSTWLGGRDLTQRARRERRERLEELVCGSERVFPVWRFAANGMEQWKQVLERGTRARSARTRLAHVGTGPGSR